VDTSQEREATLEAERAELQGQVAELESQLKEMSASARAPAAGDPAPVVGRPGRKRLLRRVEGLQRGLAATRAALEDVSGRHATAEAQREELAHEAASLRERLSMAEADIRARTAQVAQMRDELMSARDEARRAAARLNGAVANGSGDAQALDLSVVRAGAAAPYLDLERLAAVTDEELADLYETARSTWTHQVSELRPASAEGWRAVAVGVVEEACRRDSFKDDAGDPERKRFLGFRRRRGSALRAAVQASEEGRLEELLPAHPAGLDDGEPSLDGAALRERIAEQLRDKSDDELAAHFALACDGYAQAVREDDFDATEHWLVFGESIIAEARRRPSISDHDGTRRPRLKRRRERRLDALRSACKGAAAPAGSAH
jgi:hypothetical protein